jgi:hypothetical protein
MADLKGLSLEFTEAMSGWVGVGETDYVEGWLFFDMKDAPALTPRQEAFFLQAGGERTSANGVVGKFLTWLGSHEQDRHLPVNCSE